ncbi:MAG TPA: phosphoglycerate dehydrogenase [Thermoplasmata archaeon]|nr:phosphoglycerate dehydrogenase [Thermoplasmata archaeon]
MKILVNDPLDEKAIEMLTKEHEVDIKEYKKEELLEVIENYHAVLVRGRTKIDREIIEKAKNLKVIGRAGIGVDNIDIKYAGEKGIPVVNAPTGSTYSVAELTMLHILALHRQFGVANNTTKEGKWEKKRLKGWELHGKTLGLVAVGRIGFEVASRARAFGMKVVAYDPYISQEVLDKVEGKLYNSLEKVLREADVVSIHSPLTEETYHMIGEKELEIMKNSAFLVNCARGGIIDEKALYKALVEKKIAGAALDVFEHEPPSESPLLKLDNVHVTPHIGANTYEAQEKASTIAAEQVLKVLKGQEGDFVVNRRFLKR